MQVNVVGSFNLHQILFFQPETYRPGVSKIRGILSRRGSFTISRKAVIPIWPRPMSSWRSRLLPNVPFKEKLLHNLKRSNNAT